MEEFQEFDVLFSEYPDHEKKKTNKKNKKNGLDSMKVYPELLLTNSSITKEEEEEEEKNRRKKKKKKMSSPIRIPSAEMILTSSGNSILNRMDQSAADIDDCIFEEEEIIICTTTFNDGTEKDIKEDGILSVYREWKNFERKRFESS